MHDADMALQTRLALERLQTLIASMRADVVMDHHNMIPDTVLLAEALLTQVTAVRPVLAVDTADMLVELAIVSANLVAHFTSRWLPDIPFS